MDTLWENLEGCTGKGIFHFNEKKRAFEYLSYSEFNKAVLLNAYALQKRGVSKGDHLLLSATTSIEFSTLWFAIMYIGAVPVPVPPQSASIGGSGYEHRMMKLLPYFDRYLCADDEFETAIVLCRENRFTCDVISFSDFGKSPSESGSNSIPQPQRDSDETAFVQFTSGSTGIPKGVVISIGNLLANLNDIATRLDLLCGNNVLASWLPMYHDMGLVGYFLMGVFTQSTLYLIPPFQFAKRPLQFLQTISDNKVNYISMPNFALELIFSRYRPQKKYDFDLSSLKWIGLGAEPINHQTVERFYETFSSYGLREGVLSPCYGMAEATLAISISPCFKGFRVAKKGDRFYPTNGCLLDSFEMRLVNCDDDGVGEIQIKGPSVSSQSLIEGEYVNSLDGAGFYSTKDRGCFEGDELVILGRCDDMLIINGENYFPHEIESVIRDVSFVHRGRSICFSHASGLVLLYESEESLTDSIEENRTQLYNRVLSEFGITLDIIKTIPPKTVLFTSSGKVKRKAMIKLYLDGAL